MVRVSLLLFSLLIAAPALATESNFGVVCPTIDACTPGGGVDESVFPPTIDGEVNVCYVRAVEICSNPAKVALDSCRLDNEAHQVLADGLFEENDKLRQKLEKLTFQNKRFKRRARRSRK